MPFLVKDVLIIDATVIIGLFILLSFQSISSSFIESESSAFMLEWDRTSNQHRALSALLIDECDSGQMEKIFEHGNPHVKNLLTNQGSTANKICSDWMVEYVEDGYYLDELQQTGYYYGYLMQWDEDGNKRVAADYEYVFGLTITESDYLHKVATGPFYVNVTNLLMMIPFIVSAAVASFNVLYSRSKNQDEETNRASKWSVGAMGIGFVTLLIGLLIILNAFYEVYKPFIG